MQDHWYITYYCPNGPDKYSVTATKRTPAAWSVETSMKYDDGPYIVLYAEQCDREIYDLVNEHMG